jgi:CRP-like cAMP-binding protein
MTIQELEHRLSNTRRLAALTYPAIRRIARQGRLLNVKEGQIVIGPEMGSTSAYVVLEGTVNTVMPWGPVLETLGPGEIFGEISLVERVERSTYSKTETDCLLFEIPFHTFHTDLLGNPIIRAGMEELTLAREAVQRAIRQGVLKAQAEPQPLQLAEGETPAEGEQATAADSDATVAAAPIDEPPAAA